METGGIIMYRKHLLGYQRSCAILEKDYYSVKSHLFFHELFCYDVRDVLYL